jgi:hypothetical protein
VSDVWSVGPRTGASVAVVARETTREEVAELLPEKHRDDVAGIPRRVNGVLRSPSPRPVAATA